MPKLYLPTDSLAGPFSGDKILCHAEALHALMEGRVPPPITLEFDLTNVCCLNCPYCTNAAYRQEQKVSLTPPVASQTLLGLAELGAKAVTFTGGGDPLVYPEFDVMLGIAADEAELDCALITNGVLLDNCDLRYIVERLRWVRISLDAHDAASYKASKGADCWERVLSNIRMLVDAKRSTQSETTIGIGYLTDTWRWAYFPDAARVARDLGVDYIQARPLTFAPGDTRERDYPSGYSKGAIDEAKALETDTFKVYASVPKYQDIYDADRGYKLCTGVYFSCVIGATGDIWICCHMRGMPKYSLGNVYTESFVDIWQDIDRRNAIYRRIGKFEDCMPLCRFHGQNRLLSRLNWHPMHCNFL